MSVIVYSKPNCSACKRTKLLLHALEVPYEERDVLERETYLQEAQATGFSALPILIAGEEVISGFRPDKLEELFGSL